MSGQYTTATVYRNTSNGQKLLTVPKDADIYPEDDVIVMSLGMHHDKLRDEHQLYQVLDVLSDVLINYSSKINYEEDKEASEHLNEASKTLAEVRSMLDDKYNIVMDDDSYTPTKIDGRTIPAWLHDKEDEEIDERLSELADDPTDDDLGLMESIVGLAKAHSDRFNLGDIALEPMKPRLNRMRKELGKEHGPLK